MDPLRRQETSAFISTVPNYEQISLMKNIILLLTLKMVPTLEVKHVAAWEKERKNLIHSDS